MRVTNQMTHNQSIGNINRNMAHLQRLYQQTTSQKVIDRPSQSPLIASRSLRLRTRAANIEQHMNNVESGHAWMNVSEASLLNLLRGQSGDDSIFVSIKDELLRAANFGGPLDDMLIMMRNIANLTGQIGLEMNQTYAGRFVFSGWRTDQPPILNANQQGISHVVTQTFNVSDIENTVALQNPTTPGEPPSTVNVSILKLPYVQTGTGANDRQVMFGTPPGLGAANGQHDLQDGAGGLIAGVPTLGVFDPNGNPIPVIRVDPNAPGTFEPLPGTIHFVAETGELILAPDIAENFEDGYTITYQVSNLQRGDLNPLVYFDTHSEIPRVDATIPGPGNPRNFIHHWPMDNQPISYEFAVGTNIQVNALARNIFTDKFFADLNRLVNFANELEIPDRRELEQIYGLGGQGLTGDALETAITNHLSEANAAIRSVFQNRVNNMIGRMDSHVENANLEHTDLGSRMRRVEMVEIRLETDEGNFTRLLSENEDVDMTWAIIQQSIAEAAFQGALRVIANNIQLSLTSFV
ncbi:MAG: hypothetical protein FWG64_02950 [Firmicutes bacterium]|nr:hypothetical protein [Bacillota bacterium]